MKYLKNKKIIIFTLLLILLSSSLMFVNFTRSITLLDNDVEVKPNSLLTYYLDITYEGVDKYGKESSSSTNSEVLSNYIYIEDKIPDGLTFIGFVNVDGGNGNIGAYSQDNQNRVCQGFILNDTEEESSTNYRGLHYDEETRTISFRIKKLQAGCKLTIGVETMTPSIDDPNTEEVETRRDFYNYAISRELNMTKNSNTVHTWMGKEITNNFKVSYAYIGEIPEGAPALPDDATYSESSVVSIALEPRMSGYKFSGWKSDNITIEDGSFKMPNQNVTFVGSWEKDTPYKVNYTIEGDLPPSYVPPSTKEYYEGDIITLDLMRKGDIFNGYRFLGWTTENASISEENDFEMPAHDVNLVGKFEEIKYKVEYNFISSTLPNNSNLLIPKTKYYSPGEIVTLDNIEDVEGYHFLGWYSEDSFEMPNHDVIIYGEWKLRRGKFTPIINKEIIYYQDYYRTGDVVNYKITVENTGDYAIKDVIVRENNEKASFAKCTLGQFNQNNMCKSGFTSYELISDKIIRIESLSAHTAATFIASYKVTDEDSGTIENEVEIIGASADNNYDLDDSKEYKTKTSFKVQPKINICKEVLNTNNEKNFQFYITNNNNQDIWLNIKDGACQSIYLEPGSYEIQEVVPQEYTLDEISIFDGATTININNGETINIEEGKNYTITFANRYKRKGFFHSEGSVTNNVQNIITVTWIDWDGNIIKSIDILEDELKNISSLHPAPLEDYYKEENINGTNCTIDCPFIGWTLKSMNYGEYVFGPPNCARHCMM